MLTPQQVQLLDVAAAHNVEEFGKFLNARSQLMRTFEVALSGDVIDTEKVLRFGTLVGELEASMTWAQATAMLQVRNNMADMQTISLLELRDKYVAVEDTSFPDDPVERGRQIFAQCSLCHNASNQHAIGTNLFGIVDRGIATTSSFDGYSTALRTYAESEQVWSEALLDNFLKSPRTLVPGIFMGFDGLEQEKDRAAVIAYLKHWSNRSF